MVRKEKKRKNQSIQHIPKNVADSIPYLHAFNNGIIEVSAGMYSKSYIIPEANFETASTDKQLKIIKQHTEFMDSFDSNVLIQITLYNRKFDEEDFKKKLFIPMRDDNLNEYREEYNQMLLDKMAGANNSLETVKILTISIRATDVFAANDKFVQLDKQVSEGFLSIAKSEIKPLTIVERLDILHSIYNSTDNHPLYEKRKIMGKEVESFSLENCVKQGITTKDAIAPSYMDVTDTMIKIDEVYTKSYYVQAYPTWIKPNILTNFAEIPTTMLTSVFLNSVDSQEAIKYVRNKGTNVSASLVDKQKKASRSGYSTELISPDLQDAKEETNELLELLRKENMKLYNVTLVITLFAENKEEMKGYEAQLKAIGNKNLLTIKPLTRQMEQGLNSSMPIGNKQVQIDRLMTSESVSAMIPYAVRDIRAFQGMYYGINAVSGNLILHSRLSTSGSVNPNSAILGMPGAGKSFAAKREMINVLLNTDDEVYVIDPEREYKVLCENFGGSNVKIATGTQNYINPFDININNVDDEGETDPVKQKSAFIETIMEIMAGGKFGLDPKELSIIDRCVNKIYAEHVDYLTRNGKANDVKNAPTMLDFYKALSGEPQIEAQNLALSLEKYVKGSSDLFSHTTNLDINNRFIVYDIKDIGSMKELGLQVCLDNIWNKMVENKLKGKRTWFYIDEFYLLMQKQTSASYVAEIWKRARKWDGLPCAITQNVDDMLKSEEAVTVINNCAFITLLGQSPLNRQQLSAMFGLSSTEQKYIESPKPGMGLLIINNTDIIPMFDDFPKDTKLYKMITTRPDERII